MSRTDHTPEFSNERPLLSKADDTLNHATSVARIADVLRCLPNRDGLVARIHGPWGGDKAIVLNLLKQDIEADNKYVVVEFNPWIFTDETSMLGGFFRVISGAIRARMTTRGEDIAGMIEKIGQLAAVADDRLGNAAAEASEIAESSLESARALLISALAADDRRIVVLVDGIDRLGQHGTQLLFRLVKACADFPNVCYLLAFDDVAVARFLGELYGSGDESSGRAFLENIIQAPLELPPAVRQDLRSLCFKQVGQALEDAGVELSPRDVCGFISRFHRGISNRLDAPRAVKRYGNALKFAMPILRGEVDTVDLLLLEAIRAFYPAIHECIGLNHKDFCGAEPESRVRDQGGPECANLLRPIIAELPVENQAAVKSMLAELFPRLGSEFGSGCCGGSWLGEWANARRVCSPDCGSRYFSYAAPKTDVLESDYRTLVSLALSGDEPQTRTMMKSYFVAGKARQVIERLCRRETRLAPSAVGPLCLAIASMSEHLPRVPSLRGPLASMTACMLVARLISLLPAGADRVDMAKRVVSVTDSLWFGSVCLRNLYVNDDDGKAGHNLVTKQEFDEIRRVLVDRIRASASSGDLLFGVDSNEEHVATRVVSVRRRDPVQQCLIGQ